MIMYHKGNSAFIKYLLCLRLSLSLLPELLRWILEVSALVERSFNLIASGLILFDDFLFIEIITFLLFDF